MSLLWWMAIGLIAGALARLLIPGHQPMSLLMTMVLGLIGALVGGFISSTIDHYDMRSTTIHASGLMMSIIGSVIVLALYVSAPPRVLR